MLNLNEEERVWNLETLKMDMHTNRDILQIPPKKR